MLTTHKMFEEIFKIADDGIPEFKTYFNGTWAFDDRFLDIKSPIDGKIIARIPQLSEDKITTAIEAAYTKGKEEIRSYPGEKRVSNFLKAAELMKEAFEDFVNVLILDTGKPRQKNAEGEVKATIERLERTTMESTRLIGEFIPGDWSDETLETQGIVKREPFGVVLTIGPFNYPLFIPATKIIPALLVGNAIILKPASVAPLAPLMFTRILELAGFPKHSFTTLTLRGSDTNMLVQSGKICAISFTGSTQIGAEIIRNAGIKAFHLELGGKDPAIVLNDSDLGTTVNKLVKGIVSYSGQRCDAIRLILVEKQVHDQVKSMLIDQLMNISPKNPLEDTSAIMGPVIDEKSALFIEEVYNDAIDKGAKPLLKLKRTRNYVWPLLLEVTKSILPTLKAFQEDVFGPLTLMLKVQDEDEAIEIANSSKFGLDASIFGQDGSRIRKIARKLQVGAVFINEYPRHGIGYYPFGGMKQSGIGREGIGYSTWQLTTTKTIVHNFKGYGVWEYL
ncbi:MAG: aldehyde dehydrogenase family protein [Promethearchaeota archaeon]